MTKIYVAVNLEQTGKRLHAVVKNSGYSVRELQEMLDFSCPQSIYHWFQGKSIPSVENLYRLSLILRVPMESLLIGEIVKITKETY